MNKPTQKQQINALRDHAADLGAILTIRKNLYGEYETRIRLNGVREYVLSYFADSFSDAWATAKLNLNKIEETQRAIGIARVKQYESDLQTALDTVSCMLSFVDCRIQRDGDMVTMFSPKTGQHSLHMKLGVRPVNDLLVHAMGFAEAQTHARALTTTQRFTA